MAITTKGGQDSKGLGKDGKSLSEPFFIGDNEKIIDEKVGYILPALTGLNMSQIDEVLKRVGNYCHLFPLTINQQ